MKAKTILIIDDDISFVKIIRNKFKKFNIIEKNSITEAEKIKITEIAIVDYVILDYYLSNGYGVDFLSYIYTWNSKAIVFLISGLIPIESLAKINKIYPTLKICDKSNFMDDIAKIINS